MENQSRILLWRAVLDQHLKDIIEHHLVRKNFHRYYDSMKFIDEQNTGRGQECVLAMLNEQKTYRYLHEIRKIT